MNIIYVYNLYLIFYVLYRYNVQYKIRNTKELLSYYKSLKMKKGEILFQFLKNLFMNRIVI